MVNNGETVVIFGGCYSGVMIRSPLKTDRFQANVSTALNRPFIVLLEQQRALISPTVQASCSNMLPWHLACAPMNI